MKAFLSKYFKGDRIIWLCIVFLLLIGLAGVYSAMGSLAFKVKGGDTEYYLLKHGAFVFIGFIIMYFCHMLDYRYFSRIAQMLLILSFILLPITLLLGDSTNEAQRRLTILGISFQTSDLAKVSLIMYLARYLSIKQDKTHEWKTLWPILLCIVVLCGFIAPENLSTALVLFATCFLLLFIGRISLKYLGSLFGMAAVAATIGIIFLLNVDSTSSWAQQTRIPTWKARLERFMGGEEVESPQVTQAKIAVSTGGLIGKGPGKSTQRVFLPHSYSDFMFAFLIEEYGLLIGGILVMAAYFLILLRTVRIVIKSPKAFGALLAVGLGFFLCIQAFIHMGVSVNLLPVTGLTLPLVSWGGTSLIFNSLAFGAILSVSRFIDEEKTETIGSE
jgi:cell division protein FtsW